MRKRFFPINFLIILFALTAMPVLAAILDSDVDGDGVLTFEDIRVLGRDLNTLAAAYRGDANDDGVVDAKDMEHLARLLLEYSHPGEPIDAARVKTFLTQLLTSKSKPPAGEVDDRPAAVKRAEDALALREPLDIKKARQLLGLPDAPAGDDSIPESSTSTLGGNPKFPPALTGYMGKLQKNGDLKLDEVQLDITELNRRRHHGLDGIEASSDFLTIFRMLLDRSLPDLEKFSLSEAMDPSLLGATNDSALDQIKLMSTREQQQKKTFVPRARFEIRLNPQDISDMDIVGRVRQQDDITLAEEFRRVSVPPPAPTSPRLNSEIPSASDDPVLSQLMKDLKTTDVFRKRADRNKDGVVDRNEAFAFLFAPTTAQAIRSGRAASLGFSPASTLITQYSAIAAEVIPQLIQSGVMNAASGQRALAMINQVSSRGPTDTVRRPRKPGTPADMTIPDIQFETSMILTPEQAMQKKLADDSTRFVTDYLVKNGLLDSSSLSHVDKLMLESGKATPEMISAAMAKVEMDPKLAREIIDAWAFQVGDANPDYAALSKEERIKVFGTAMQNADSSTREIMKSTVGAAMQYGLSGADPQLQQDLSVYEECINSEVGDVYKDIFAVPDSDLITPEGGTVPDPAVSDPAQTQAVPASPPAGTE